jgi:hypothetical protein
MRIAHKTALVVLFLLLIEVLYLHVDPVSFGLPFRSVEYRSENITGTSWSWLGEEQPFGFNVEPILFVSDVLVVFFLSLLLIRCVPAGAIVPVVQGCVLGSVTGAAIFWLSQTLLESWLPTTVGLTLLFLIVPLIIYMLSLKHKLQKTNILVIAFTTVTTFGCASLLIEALSDGVDEGFFNLGVVPRLLALTGVLAFACFVMMLLHKRVLPILLRKKKLNSLPESTAHNTAPKLARSPKQADRKSTIKSSILYASLLAITIYVGYHFMTVRKMRHDEWLVFEAIESELEQLGFPLKGRILSMELNPESFEAGLNASCQAEVKVDDKNMYYAEIRKRLLIPWIQIEIYKKGTSTQTNASNSSLE